MTPAQRTAYLESRGQRCPYCGAWWDIEGGPVTIDDGAAYQDVWCACGKAWTDCYKLSNTIPTAEGDA